MRALVVDDSSTMRSVMRRILVMRGFEVLEAKHGVDALRVLAEQGAADVGFFDWNMPEMDGLELLTKVRQNPAYEKMQIVMVTTETGANQVLSALSAGASDYLTKPFTSTQVDEKLSSLGLVEVA